MNLAIGSMRHINFMATAVCLLMNSKAAHCVSKDEDNKGKDFSSFIKQFGDKSIGEIFEKAAGAAGISKGDADMNASYLFDTASTGVRKMFESGKPQEVGYGFMMGYCSGFCVKKVSKIAAIGVGGVFVGLQALSYNGFIKIDYEGVQKKIESEFDFNHDGKVDTEDLALGYKKMSEVLSFHMPSGGGFSAGLVMGLRG